LVGRRFGGQRRERIGSVPFDVEKIEKSQLVSFAHVLSRLDNGGLGRGRGSRENLLRPFGRVKSLAQTRQRGQTYRSNLGRSCGFCGINWECQTAEWRANLTP